jgi:hypothetical protein
MAPFRIAILWRGDREARRTASAQNNRYHRIFEELSGLGIHAEPAVYDEEFADEVCEHLLKVDGVLVWVDPLSRGKTRALLDPMLRDVASRGPWISASSRCDSQDGDQGSSLPHKTSRLGHRYSPLPHRY